MADVLNEFQECEPVQVRQFTQKFLNFHILFHLALEFEIGLICCIILERLPKFVRPYGPWPRFPLVSLINTSNVSLYFDL